MILRDSWWALLWSWMFNHPHQSPQFSKEKLLLLSALYQVLCNCPSSGSPVRKDVAVYSQARDKKEKNGWRLSCSTEGWGDQVPKMHKCLLSKAWRIKDIAAFPCCIAQPKANTCYPPKANKHIFIRYTHRSLITKSLVYWKKREHLPLEKSMWTQSTFPLVPPRSCRLETGDIKRQGKIPRESESSEDFDLPLWIPDLSMLFGIYLN